MVGCARRAVELTPPLEDAEAAGSDGEAEARTLLMGSEAARGMLTEAVEGMLAAVGEEGAEAAPARPTAATLAKEAEAEAAAEVEAEEGLWGLEVQLWLELDAFLRAIAARNGGVMPVPAQLLSLLPPPPAAGWPGVFRLHQEARGAPSRRIPPDLF